MTPELTVGLTFSSWEDFKNWIHMFGLKEGFNYRIRSSETTQGVMRRATYECAKSGTHNPQTISDPTKVAQCSFTTNTMSLET